MSDRVVVIHEHDTAIPIASLPGSLVVVREPADSIVVREQAPAAIAVLEQPPPVVVVREQAPTVVAIASPAQGPAGVGPSGTDGQPRYTGHGDPPDFIFGAHPGDEYLDVDSGNIWKLT